MSGENDPFTVAVHRPKKKEAGPAQKERSDRDWMVLPFSANMSVGTGRPCRSKVKTASLMYLSPREISYQPPSSVMLKMPHPVLLLLSQCSKQPRHAFHQGCVSFLILAECCSPFVLWPRAREAVCNGDLGLFVCSVSIVFSSACGIH